MKFDKQRSNPIASDRIIDEAYLFAVTNTLILLIKKLVWPIQLITERHRWDRQYKPQRRNFQNSQNAAKTKDKLLNKARANTCPEIKPFKRETVLLLLFPLPLYVYTNEHKPKWKYCLVRHSSWSSLDDSVMRQHHGRASSRHWGAKIIYLVTLLGMSFVNSKLSYKHLRRILQINKISYKIWTK